MNRTPLTPRELRTLAAAFWVASLIALVGTGWATYNLLTQPFAKLNAITVFGGVALMGVCELARLRVRAKAADVEARRRGGRS